MRIEGRTVLYFDGARTACEGNRQGVIAHDSNARDLCRCRQRAITCRGKEHVGVGYVIAFEC